MDVAYTHIKEQKQNNQSGLLVWMKEAKIIDGKEVKEADVKKYLSEKGSIALESFMECLKKLSDGSKEKLDQMTAKLCACESVMAGVFEKLKAGGKDNVENIVDWMKNAKLVEPGTESENKAKALLTDSANKTGSELAKFKDTVGHMAEDTAKRYKDLSETLEKQGQQVLEAVQATGTAFMAAFSGSKKEDKK